MKLLPQYTSKYRLHQPLQQRTHCLHTADGEGEGGGDDRGYKSKHEEDKQNKIIIIIEYILFDIFSSTKNKDMLYMFIYIIIL